MVFQIFFKLLLIASAGFLSVKSVVSDSTLTFDKVYTNSARYTLLSSDVTDPTVVCIFSNQITGSIFECKTPSRACFCSSGVIINLQQNSTYVIQVRKDDELLTSGPLRTASNGELRWSYGISSITYDILYGESDIIPSECLSSIQLYNLISNTKLSIPSSDQCVSGSFSDLMRNTSYSLIVENNDNVMHSIQTSTGFYDINWTYIGLESVSYQAYTNLNFQDDTCEFILSSDSSKLGCNDSTDCSCFFGNITGLSRAAIYNSSVTQKSSGEFLQSFNFNTGDTSTMTYYSYYNGLNFSLTYTDERYIPSHCYPCLYKSTDPEITVEDCKNDMNLQSLVPQFCINYYYSAVTQMTYYNTLLIDAFGVLISRLYSAYVVRSEVVHNSYQLTSINYELVSDLNYDRTKPCNIYSSSGSKRSCEVNGQKTTDCICSAGKLVDLAINAYIFVELKQGEALLAKDERMYTADDGYLSTISVGLYHYQYLIEYYYNTHPPYQCKACLYSTSETTNQCDPTNYFFGRTTCRTEKWTALTNSSEHRLEIFDADNVRMYNRYISTSSLPTFAVFTPSNDELYYRYKLTYVNSDLTPQGCNFYFEEDPTYTLTCERNTACTCVEGSVVRPPGQKYIRLVILDADNVELGRFSPADNSGSGNGSSSLLSVGVIIGICIFVFLTITVICLTIVLLVLKNTRKNNDTQNYSN